MIPPPKRVIKKYQNRRLYDTVESIYITLTEVRELVMNGVDFIVQDARSNEDITRQVLLSIILEEEAGGVPLFSNQLLRQIISFYGNTLQSAFGKYLEGNIRGFVDAQKQWQNKVHGFIAGTSVPDTVSQMMNLQSGNVPNLFGAYLENGKKMFDMMRDSFDTNPWKKFSGESNGENNNIEPQAKANKAKVNTKPQIKIPVKTKAKETVKKTKGNFYKL